MLAKGHRPSTPDPINILHQPPTTSPSCQPPLPYSLRSQKLGSTRQMKTRLSIKRASGYATPIEFNDTKDGKRRKLETNLAPKLKFCASSTSETSSVTSLDADSLEGSCAGEECKINAKPALKRYWELMFKKLKSFKAREGHCNVSRHKSKTKELGKWVSNQRHLRTKMAKGRKQKLDSIGFSWSMPDYMWNKVFNELRDFKAREGHFNVSRRGDNRKLGAWVHTQIRMKMRLPEKRTQKLESIGFDFNLSASSKNKASSPVIPLDAEIVDAGSCASKGCKRKAKLVPKKNLKFGNLKVSRVKYWELMFNELKSFKAREGHCNVSIHVSETKELGKWVSNQRHLRTSIVKGRKQKLDSIGFSWNVPNDIWNKMFNELRDFKAREGHFNISRNGGDNMKLGEWVHQQKQRKMRLLEERKQRLESIGVVFGK